jgi:hypothetical protein
MKKFYKNFKINNSLKILLILLILLVLFFYYNKSFNNNFEYFTSNNKKICGKYKLNRIDIWKNVKDKYGIEIADKIFPRTYILPDEINELMKDPNKHFILKTKWGSYRKGVKLFDSKQNIFKEKNNFNIGQVYIKNPLLIDGFKFDIRVFMVTFCGKGSYLYKNAYNVYTKKRFNYYSMDRDEKINQCFGSDSFYDEFNLPRTTLQLAQRTGINMNEIWNNLVRKLKIVLNSTEPLCCEGDINNYNIYGLDIELLNNLDPMIIEINKSPDMHFDEEWKNNLIKGLKDNIQTGNFNNKNLWIQISK